MKTILGHTIQIDRSGVGHAWRDVDADDLPPSIYEEIETEIAEGNTDPDDYKASNGLCYRWH
jgi:hypothetical protein